MKLTIVTVSFNQCRFLRDAIDSVLNQDYGELEYIIVDPGSTDGSRQVIDEYSHRIAKVLLNPDLGAADGLNKGFAAATGSIYGFLNSDDMLLPGALTRVAECFRHNPTADIVMGDGFITDEHGRRIRHIKAASFTPTRLIYGGTTSLQQSTFFRRSAYAESSHFNVQNRSSWDVELFLELVQRGAAIKYLRADLSLFRIHSESITGSNRAKAIYKADQNRLFRGVLGRDRRWSDALLSVYYKSLRFMKDPGQLGNTLNSRLHSSCTYLREASSSYRHSHSRDSKGRGAV